MLKITQANTTFKLNLVSLRAFAYALRVHYCAIVHPSLEGLHAEEKKFEREMEFMVERCLYIRYSRREMDENGYEIGYVRWDIKMQIYEREAMGLYGEYPIDLDPYLVSVGQYEIVNIDAPGATEAYTPAEEEDLESMSDYMLQCALDNVKQAVFQDGTWYIGKDKCELGSGPYTLEDV